jgi:outer membrane autotransporter protein
VSGFEVGDEVILNISYTGSAGTTLYLMGVDGGVSLLRQIFLNSTPMVETYTVTGLNNDLALELNYGGGAAITVVASCAGTPPGPTPGVGRSQAVTRGFLASRINGILMGDPTNTNLLYRQNATTTPTNIASAGSGNNVASSAVGLGSGLGSAMGLGAGRLGDDTADVTGGKSIQFSQSLSQLRRQAAQSQAQKDRMALGAGDGGSSPLAYDTASPWDLWVEGRYSGFNDDNGNLDRNGHVGVLYVGGDYRLTENMIVGVLAQFDWAKDDSSVLASEVSGNGWMVGPYLSARVHDNIYFDLRAAWGRSSNDLTLDAATGSFDTSRWLVKGTLAGNWTYGAWRLTPSADLAYITESADAFTNSAGIFVPGQDVSLGRLQFGPEFGYRFAHTASTFIEPFAAIKGVWDFDNPNVAIIDGYVVGPSDFWGRLQGGLNVATTSGWYVRGLASWDGLGTADYNGYTLQGTVNVPLN